MTTISGFSRSLLLFLIACLGHFIVDFSIGLWPIWKTIEQFSLIEAGIVAGVSVFIGEGMQIYFGVLGDRGHWKSLVGIGALVASASLAFPLSDTIVGAGILLFLTCLGSSAFHPTAVGVISSIEGIARPIIIAIFHTSGLLGLAISQSLFSLLYEQGQYLPLVLGALPILLAILIYFTQESRTQTASQNKEAISWRAFLEFLQRADLRKVYFLLLSNQIMAWSFLFLLPELLMEKGASASLVYGGGHCIYVFGAASTCVPLGILASRLNTPLVILMTYIGSIIALCLTLILNTSNPFILGACLFAFGATSGAIAPLSLAVGNDLEPRRRATVSAFLMGFVWIFSEGFGYSCSSYIASCFTQDPATNALLCVGTVLIFGVSQAYFLFNQLQSRPEERAQVLVDV